MAVKPVVQPEVWASNALYTTGPFIGSASKVVPPGPVAAEGHRPGASFPTPAEYENSQQNAITLLSQWVFAGSSAGAPDAHIVETDGTGRATLHGLTVTNTTTQTCVFATGNSAGLPVYRATQPTGGDGFLAALSGSTGSAFSSELSGSSTGLDIDMDTVASPGVGALIVADAATTAEAMTVTHAGAVAAAVTITATGTGAQALAVEADDDAALFAEGGVSGSSAILGLGKTIASGVRGSGGPGGANGVEGFGTGASAAGVFGLSALHGVAGQATDAAAGFGVYGVSDGAAVTVTAGGVHGEGLADGVGVFGEAVDGYGGLFTANGDRPTVFLTARTTDPTATASGALWHRTNRGLSTFQQGVARLLWHTAGGPGTAWDSAEMNNVGATVDENEFVVMTCTLNGADTPVVAGIVWIFVTMEIGRTSGSSSEFYIQIGDDTNTDYPIQTTVPLFQPGTATMFERNVVYLIPFQLNGIGITQFSTTIKSTVAGEDINYRNAAMAVIGVF